MWPESRLNIAGSYCIWCLREIYICTYIVHCSTVLSYLKSAKYTLHIFFYWFCASFHLDWFGVFFFINCILISEWCHFSVRGLVMYYFTISPHIPLLRGIKNNWSLGHASLHLNLNRCVQPPYSHLSSWWW